MAARARDPALSLCLIAWFTAPAMPPPRITLYPHPKPDGAIGSCCWTEAGALSATVAFATGGIVARLKATKTARIRIFTELSIFGRMRYPASMERKVRGLCCFSQRIVWVNSIRKSDRFWGRGPLRPRAIDRAGIGHAVHPGRCLAWRTLNRMLEFGRPSYVRIA
jgi:hypothetical protein